MKEEKRHVGRPTNEEVRQRNNKQMVRIFCVIILVLLIALGVKTINLNNLTGNANNSNVCKLQLTPKQNQINVKVTCGLNAKANAIYLKNENLSMRGKKFFNVGYGKGANFTLKNIDLGKHVIILAYDRKISKKVYNNITVSASTTISQGSSIPFYNLSEDEICSATAIGLKDNKLTYKINCGKKAKLYNVVIWDNSISDSREINYKSKTAYGYGENTTRVCGSGCYNIKANGNYHIRLYWTTSDITSKTGLNLYVRSTGNFDRKTIYGESSSEVINTTTRTTTTKKIITTTRKVKTTKKVVTTTKKVNSDYIKVLLIGNSYTYYNGYGQMITKLAAKTGKKLIVVRATYPNYSANDLIKASNKGRKINYVAWSSTVNKTNNAIYSGTATLDKIIKAKFGLEANYWDYVIVQNNGKISGDKNMYSFLVSKDVKFKKYMINATHYSSGLGSSRKEQHIKAVNDLNNTLKQKGKTPNAYVIKSGNVIGKYGSNWDDDLIFNDPAHHMSGRGAYLYALVTYAKIYGISEFAKSTSDSNFIPLYSDGTTKDFAPNKYNAEKCNKKISRCKVDKEMAKKLQSIVRNYYE